MERDSCSRLTFGTVVLLFRALASLPPPPLQYLQPVIFLELEDGQRDLISERRPWPMTGKHDKSKSWGTDKVQQQIPTKRRFTQEKREEKHEMRSGRKNDRERIVVSASRWL